MAKYRDQAGTGRSSVVRYVPGETWDLRHARRLEANLTGMEFVREWCTQMGVEFSTGNGGHHWKFRQGEVHADWWPSSAKLVLNERWGRVYTCMTTRS